MKKILFCIAAAACTICLKAENTDEILDRIEKAPIQKENIVGTVQEVRTPAMKDQGTVTLKGAFLFKDNNFLSIKYDNDDQFIIDGTRMVIMTAGQNQVFDTSKNLMMKNLSSVLIYSCSGTLRKLAQEQDSDISAVKEGKYYTVTLTARKKSARGLSKLVVNYDASKCGIRSLTMYEVTGATTSYTLE